MEAQLWEVGEINAKYTSNPKPEFKNQSHVKATECWSRNSHTMCTSNLKLTNQSHIKAKAVLEKEVTEVQNSLQRSHSTKEAYK